MFKHYDLKITAAADMPDRVISEKQLEEEFANDENFGYDEGSEDDIDEDDQSDDDGRLTKNELQEIEDMNLFYKNASNRESLSIVANRVTVVTLGNTYSMFSHDHFPDLRYPNRFFRSFHIVRDPSVYGIEIYCSYFRLQRSIQCRKDRVIVYLPPYTNGKKYCGRKHGLRLKYYDDLRVIFKTDRRRRRVGFSCSVSTEPFPSPPTCCEIIPVEPSSRTVVSTCADLLPGFDYCQCTQLSDGLCLICSFCENCHLEFLAVHDFSQTKLYIYFTFPCNNCTIDFATNSYGHEQHVAGYVRCLNPSANVILPTYPTNAFVVALFCPASPTFDVCGFFQSQISGSGRRLPLQNAQEEVTKTLIMGTGSLAKSCGASIHLVILEDTFDFSFVNNPECVGAVTITSAPCSNFTQNGITDLTLFTNIKIISLNLCTPSLSCGSIIINSPAIQEVSVSGTTSCDSYCIVNNQVTSSSPTIVGC